MHSTHEASTQLTYMHANSIIERNNSSIVAWTAKAPFNPLAHDLLRIVEVFADDSKFRSGVNNSSAEALAILLQVSAPTNGLFLGRLTPLLSLRTPKLLQ